MKKSERMILHCFSLLFILSHVFYGGEGSGTSIMVALMFMGFIEKELKENEPEDFIPTISIDKKKLSEEEKKEITQ